MLKKIALSEDGSVFLMVFFCAVLISVLGVTAYYVANTELTQASKKYEMAKALYLAEGGLERAIGEMVAGIDNGWDDEVAGADAQVGTGDDGILNFGSQVDCHAYGEGDAAWSRYLGHYDVKIVDGRRPGESPGKCNRVIIGSEGVSTKNFKRRVEAEVELWELHLPQALVYIDGQEMDTKFDGNAFMLDGKDTNPDESSGPGPDVPAILVSRWQDVSPIRGEISGNQCDQVLGVGNLYGDNPCTPSVLDLGSWNPNNFNPNKFRSKDLPKLETMVNNTISGGTYADHTTIGSEDEYLITQCTGDLHISGQFYGYGVLIVEGNLVVTGRGRWDGLIVAKNHARMSGGGNGFHLYGTLLVMDESGDDSEDEFRFSGQADGFYSTQTVTRVQESVRTVVVNRWRQTVGM